LFFAKSSLLLFFAQPSLMLSFTTGKPYMTIMMLVEKKNDPYVGVLGHTYLMLIKELALWEKL